MVMIVIILLDIFIVINSTVFIRYLRHFPLNSCNRYVTTSYLSIIYTIVRGILIKKNGMTLNLRRFNGHANLENALICLISRWNSSKRSRTLTYILWVANPILWVSYTNT